MKARIPLIVLLPLILSLTNCSSSISLQSNWTKNELPLDINDPIWQTGLTRLDDEPIYFNSINDNEFLYLYITTADQTYERQILTRGLTVWFDSTGGSDKLFGIDYPIGLRNNEFMRQQYDRNKQELPGREELTSESLKELEIIGPLENQKFRTPPDGSKGITAKIERKNGNFTYMLKVPLYKSSEHYFAIGTNAGRQLGVGIELNKPTFPRLGLPGERGGTGGFRPPEDGMGMPGGQMGRGGFRGRGGREQLKEFEVWCNLTLAK